MEDVVLRAAASTTLRAAVITVVGAGRASTGQHPARQEGRSLPRCRPSRASSPPSP